jgi:type VII secretion protein EssB
VEKGTFEEVNITTTEERVEVSLESHQYRLERLEQYHFFLSPKRNLLAGKINKTKENTLIIQYQKSKYSQSLTQIIKKSDDFERLLIAQKITCLADFMHSPIRPLLHPDNLFLLGEEIMIAHRGFMQEVVPYVLEENDFLKQYRMLVFAILYPGINSENLFNGEELLKDNFLKLLYCAESVEKMNQILGEQIIKQKEKRTQKLQLVNKKTYVIFKWASLVFSLSTIGFSLMIENYVFRQLPRQERISLAKSQYIASDYTGVLTTLKNDLPETLSTGAQYVAAVSSIQLENLTDSQKKAILTTFTQETNEARLLYWIYIGKGNFHKSLEIAQTIGDEEYLLHVYTKLYAKTKTNHTMDSKEKQKLLLEYETKMEHYTKKLGEEKNWK